VRQIDPKGKEKLEANLGYGVKFTPILTWSWHSDKAGGTYPNVYRRFVGGIRELQNSWEHILT
jgi:hypothetical protein